MFRKILVANRGEIALRVIRACRELGIATVAVHSTADHDAMHVRLADEAVCIGPASAKESYLNTLSILSAATITGADAVHPGYGFLSENADFVAMVEEHGLTFVGPKSDHIRIMGHKITAKKTVESLGIPVVPGSDGGLSHVDEALSVAQNIGYPVLVKAANGGGGKGMKIAFDDHELKENFQLARQEAKANFGSDEVYLEKYLQRPRHIEIQVLGDHEGSVIHLGERDCSLQRHHQKVLEECPGPQLSTHERDAIGEVVCKALGQLGYNGLGTVEFLYEDGQFYFIEMNTRLQVEHPVTEMVTGIDLVREQILVAARQSSRFRQQDIRWTGHAIECRINAEHPWSFAPCPGLVKDFHAPGGPGVRVDSALYAGYKIPPYYDSLVAKIIVHAETRDVCIERAKRALTECVIGPVTTNLELHRALMVDHDIRKGDYDIHWLSKFVKAHPIKHS